MYRKHVLIFLVLSGLYHTYRNLIKISNQNNGFELPEHSGDSVLNLYLFVELYESGRLCNYEVMHSRRPFYVCSGNFSVTFAFLTKSEFSPSIAICTYVTSTAQRRPQEKKKKDGI